MKYLCKVLRYRNNIFGFLVLLLYLGLVSCSTIEEIPGSTGPITDDVIPSAIDSPLVNFIPAIDSSSQTNKNFAQILDIGEESLLARIHLIRSARKNIAVQTIIWINDEVGRLVVYELILAAKRGVKVQLLIDHFASEKHIEVASFLSSVHPNFKVKIYNPIVENTINPSLFSKILSLLFSFNRFNQRMHNKLFIIDDVISITGGRNYQNAYFDQAKGLNYKDRDVMVIGPVVEEMRKSFNAFWNFNRSIPLNDLDDVQYYKKHNTVKIWGTRDSFQLHGLFEDINEKSSSFDTIKKLFADRLHVVEDAYFVADDPGKNKGKWIGRYSGLGKITRELAKLVLQATESIYIQTPYLVLSDQAIDLFKQIRETIPDLDIRISTNSLAATDSWYVYALSYKQKRTYLDTLKFIMYEFKPLPGDMDTFMPTYNNLLARPMTPSEEEDQEYPFLCLHSKSMVIDDEISFIGSYNLDPRSENINTEAGLVIRDRDFAKRLKSNIKKDMEPQNSWVIAQKIIPLGLTTPNAILEEFSSILPIVDPWPFRYTSSFELIENKQPVEIGDKDFYENFRDVGSFPKVDEGGGMKSLGASAVKTFFNFVKPLL